GGAHGRGDRRRPPRRRRGPRAPPRRRAREAVPERRARRGARRGTRDRAVHERFARERRRVPRGTSAVTDARPYRRRVRRDAVRRALGFTAASALVLACSGSAIVIGDDTDLGPSDPDPLVDPDAAPFEAS